MFAFCSLREVRSSLIGSGTQGTRGYICVACGDGGSGARCSVGRRSWGPMPLGDKKEGAMMIFLCHWENSIVLGFGRLNLVQLSNCPR